MPRHPGKTKPAHAKTQPAASAPGRALIDMEQAIELLKTSRPTFYRWLRSGQIKGLKAGRQWRFYREDIDRFIAGQGPRIDLRADITPLIDALRRRLTELGGKEPTWGDEPEVVRACLLMIALGARMRASDVHIEPGTGQASLRYRLDGVLQPAIQFDMRLLPAVIERFKTMADCNVQEKVRPQDGTMILASSQPQMPESIKLRACFLPAIGGESLTLRLLSADPISVGLNIAQLDFSPTDEKRVLEALSRPWGLIIVTGPTGTGKTTTLYSCLQKFATPERKIICIEDPVEWSFPGMTQVQIRPDAGLTFATAFRAAMRSAPNAIMIGEIRDAEVAALCYQAALAGHVVFATLHTDDAPNAIKRMIDIFVPPHLVADATTLIIAQRLLRKLCTHCAKDRPDPLMLRQAEEIARRGGVDLASLNRRFRQPVGCLKCNNTGYRGRMLIAETMAITSELSTAIARGAGTDELRAIAIGQGMTTMAADGIRKAAAGTTTIEEVIRTLGAGAY